MALSRPYWEVSYSFEEAGDVYTEQFSTEEECNNFIIGLEDEKVSIINKQEYTI